MEKGGRRGVSMPKRRMRFHGTTGQACWDQWDDWIERHWIGRRDDTIHGVKIIEAPTPTVFENGKPANSYTMIVEYKERLDNSK
jgi:hypothetical protein